MHERIEDLPETVKDVLPEAAQEIYLEAFNKSWELYDPERDSQMSQEAVANRDAWAAVKREYTKDDDTGKWYPEGEVPEEGEEEEGEGLIDTLTDLV